MRRLGVGNAHLGRERFKYVYQVRDIAACDLAGLEADGFVGVRVQWTRGPSHRTVTQWAALTTKAARVDFCETPMLVCSMFRLRKSGIAFDPKPSQFKLVAVRADGTYSTVGSCTVHLDMLVNLEEAELNPSMHINAPLTMRHAVTRASAAIHLTLTARPFKSFDPEAEVDENATSAVQSASSGSGHSSDGEGVDDWDSDVELPEQQRRESRTSAAARLAPAPSGDGSETQRRAGAHTAAAAARAAPSEPAMLPAEPHRSQPAAAGAGGSGAAPGARAPPPAARAAAPLPDTRGASAHGECAPPGASAASSTVAAEPDAILQTERRLRDELARALSRSDALRSACTRLEDELVALRGARARGEGGAQPAVVGQLGASEKAAAALAGEAAAALAAAAASAAAAAQARADLDVARRDLAACRRSIDEAAAAHAAAMGAAARVHADELAAARAHAAALSAQLVPRASAAERSTGGARSDARANDDGRADETAADGTRLARAELVCAIVALRAQLVDARAQLLRRHEPDNVSGIGALCSDRADARADASARVRVALSLGDSVDEIAVAAAGAMLPPGGAGCGAAGLPEQLVGQLVGALDEINTLEARVNEAKMAKREAVDRAHAAEARSTLLEAQLSALLNVHAAKLSSSSARASDGAAARTGAGRAPDDSCASEGECAFARAFGPTIERLEQQLSAITAERDRLRWQLRQRAGIVSPAHAAEHCPGDAGLSLTLARRSSAGDMRPAAAMRSTRSAADELAARNARR